MDQNGLIGAGGDLPWRLPEDLRHFRRKTVGKPILMGRRTFESIGRPLPKRDNLVLTRDASFAAEGVRRVGSFREARDAARAAGARELVVIGGAEVYALALPRVDVIYLTRVHDVFEGDTYFPGIDFEDWEQVARERHPADAEHPFAYSFIELRRRD